MPQKRSQQRSQSQEPERPPRLVVSRAEAAEKIQNHLDRGITLRDQNIASYDELYEAEQAMWRWSDRTDSLLEGLFDNPSIAKSTRLIAIGGSASNMTPIGKALDFYRNLEWSPRLSSLRSVLERLDDYQETDMVSPSKSSFNPAGTDVFIVYGHDQGARQEVARYIETQLKLRVIMLDEDYSASSATLVEEVERQSTTVGYAVILLTPDDVGSLRGVDTLQQRARQNVILETGYFWGKVGRPKMCILKKGDVEIPSDFQGIRWVPLDDFGGWKGKLEAMLRGAGLLAR